MGVRPRRSEAARVADAQGRVPTRGRACSGEPAHKDIVGMLPPPAQEACESVWIPAYRQRMHYLFEAMEADSEFPAPPALGP